MPETAVEGLGDTVEDRVRRNNIQYLSILERIIRQVRTQDGDHFEVITGIEVEEVQTQAELEDAIGHELDRE